MSSHYFKLKCAIISLPVLFASHQASAACQWASGMKAQTIKFTMGTIYVQNDTPLNQVIAAQTVPAFSAGDLLTCDADWIMQSGPGVFNEPTSSSIYRTNVTGIGMRLYMGNFYMPGAQRYGANQYGRLNSAYFTFIKYSSVSGLGTLTNGIVAKFYPREDPTFLLQYELTGTNVIVPVGCTLNATTINVALDTAGESEFKGIGTTVKPKNFDIDLSCQKGANIKLTLDGTKAGPAGVLALNAGGGQASGLGIQLLSANKPVALGTAMDLGVVTADGQKKIPLTARYYQTAASIKNGRTNATATFTITNN